MMFRCLKNYEGKMDFAGPQGIWYSFIFSIDINHSLYFSIIHYTNIRLQNGPYFCVFKYARAVKQKVCNEAENRERDWGETLKIHLVSHALRA